MKIRITSYEESASVIRSIRDTVFVEEQRVAREIDCDGKDPLCIHVLATDDVGRPIGTGRIQPDGRIGRLAVLKDSRGLGVGSRMLETLLESARANSLVSVYLHAQVHAAAFYEKLGFQRDGAEFMEAGIRHVNMTKRIR